MTEPTPGASRIYVGEEEAGDVARALFVLVEEQGLDPRVVVWVPGDRAFDVPEDVANKYVEPEKPKRARKAAKAAPPPTDAEPEKE